MQSAANWSLRPKLSASREINRNFAKPGRPSQFLCPINARIQSLTAEFSTQPNREFLSAYQGILFEKQGSLIKQQRPLNWRNLEETEAVLWRNASLEGQKEGRSHIQAA
jgi:hypothetical protein